MGVWMGQQGLQAPGGRQELHGGLGADPGHAGDVVRAVPGEGQEVRDLGGGEAPLRSQLGHADPGVLAGVVDDDPVREELEGVLVHGHEGDLVVLG
jgi:hypothetical protein